MPSRPSEVWSLLSEACVSFGVATNWLFTVGGYFSYGGVSGWGLTLCFQGDLWLPLAPVPSEGCGR